MNRLEEWREAGREVSVAGLARSGFAAVRLLRAYDLSVYASDNGSGSDVAATAARLRTEFPSGVTVETGGHDLARIGRSAALILSPGIPPAAAVATAAKAAGVVVLAEAQIGLDALPGVPYVAVTGTNGKSTVTALVDHLLCHAGISSVAAGNIGTALSAVAMVTPRPQWLAVELSSFQLHDCPDIAPTVGILTNLAPDHLDRYPTLEAYYADKAQLFRHASAGSIWVSNLDDPASRAMVSDVAGRHFAFSVADGVKADGWYQRTGGRLMLAGHPLMPRAALPLLGDHNVANALAASLAVHAVGISPVLIAEGLASFRALTHRMEPVREVQGVLWINDSKATNVASTLVAVQAMTRPFVLLLGGRHKGEPYTALREPLQAHGTAVIAYGEAAERVESDLAGAIPVVRGGTFEDCMAKAAGLVPKHGVVLLSPACSSYDMFDNYEHRGATFRELVEAM
jgi:UDP-N-acetylmuramoylalanine--D-glutamate ligase